jgi:membrane-bound ClpP family serine protease
VVRESQGVTEGGSPTRYLLIWLDWESSIDAIVLSRLRWDIEDTVGEPRKEVEVDVWLESPGGDAHAAYKLAMMLRDVAGHIRVIVPDYAKSAATLLTLVADDLYLAPGAELGPLDAQIPEEGSLHPLSALNVARAADSVAQDAVALALKGAADMVKELKIKRVDALGAMLDFSAKFSEPLVRQLDPRLVHQANELLRVTVRYATLLLTPTVGAQQAGQIAKELVEKFPTHGFVIARDEA